MMNIYLENAKRDTICILYASHMQRLTGTFSAQRLERISSLGTLVTGRIMPLMRIESTRDGEIQSLLGDPETILRRLR